MAFDPQLNRMRKKKIMLDHIKGKRNQRVYADQIMKRLTEKLMAGWNPWIEALQPLEYTKWEDVLEKYKAYLVKMCNEGSMREETYVDYSSRVRILERWKKEKNIVLNFSYQWDQSNVSKFLDYIFIDRNNTVLTRNNYLAWTKSFSTYLLARGYIPKNPTEGLGRIKNRQKKTEMSYRIVPCSSSEITYRSTTSTICWLVKSSTISSSALVRCPISESAISMSRLRP